MRLLFTFALSANIGAIAATAIQASCATAVAYAASIMNSSNSTALATQTSTVGTQVQWTAGT